MFNVEGKMKIINVSGIVCLSLISFVLAAQAEPYVSAVDRSRQDYPSGVSRKLGRGLSNAGMGWVEIFKGAQKVSDESGYWAGATWGPIYGVVNAAKRTGAGIFETATFAIPNGKDFEPILDPEFVLD
jgi:putative exosortase-associated protein (TIGR04073 family)